MYYVLRSVLCVFSDYLLLVFNFGCFILGFTFCFVNILNFFSYNLPSLSQEVISQSTFLYQTIKLEHICFSLHFNPGCLRLLVFQNKWKFILTYQLILVNHDFEILRIDCLNIDINAESKFNLNFMADRSPWLSGSLIRLE